MNLYAIKEALACWPKGSSFPNALSHPDKWKITADQDKTLTQLLLEAAILFRDIEVQAGIQPKHQVEARWNTTIQKLQLFVAEELGETGLLKITKDDVVSQVRIPLVRLKENKREFIKCGYVVSFVKSQSNGQS